jgi:hypothetical protein
VGIERRGNRLYLYDRTRVNGRCRGQYQGPVNSDYAKLLAESAELIRAERTLALNEVKIIADEAAAIVTALDPFDSLADRVVRSVLQLSGYHQHHRGEWRRRRGVQSMGLVQELVEAYAPKKPTPALVRPVSQNPEHQKILDLAAKGCPSALPAVKELLKDPSWAHTIGSVAWMAETFLIQQASGDDLAVAEAVRQKLREHVQRLTEEDGPNPPFAVKLTAIRAAHCWLAVHSLEAMAARYKAGSATALAIEKQMASAERRLNAALRSLALLRRLNRPAVIAQVNVASGAPMVVKN